jgi:hypothetical protein
VNRSNRAKAIVYAVALLVFGGIIGFVIKASVSPTPQSLRVGRVDQIEVFIRQRLDEKLDLTPQQKQRMEPYIRKAAEEMEAAHLDCLKRVNKAADDLHAQIKPELVGEQVEKLPELDAERLKRMQEKYNYQSTTNASLH